MYRSSPILLQASTLLSQIWEKYEIQMGNRSLYFASEIREKLPSAQNFSSYVDRTHKNLTNSQEWQRALVRITHSINSTVLYCDILDVIPV